MPKQPLQPTEDGSESNSSSQCRIKAPVGLQNIHRFLRPSAPSNSSSGYVDTPETTSIKPFKKPATPVGHFIKTSGGNPEAKNACKPALNAKLSPKRSMLQRYAEDVDEGTLVVDNVGLAKKLRISRESSLADTELANSEDEDDWLEPYDDEYVIARMQTEEELSYVNMSRLSQSQSELQSYSMGSSGMSQKVQGLEGTVLYIVRMQKQTFTGESAASHGTDSARTGRSASKRTQELQLQDQERVREPYPAESENDRQLEQRRYTDYMLINSATTQIQHHGHANNATIDNDTNGVSHSDAEMTIEERYGLQGLTADDIRHRLKGGQTVRECSYYALLNRMDVFAELGRKMASKLEDVNKTFEKNDTFYSTVLSELAAHRVVLAKQGRALEERRKNLESHFFGFEKAVGVKLR
ncbi:hypothetical protein SpCBS45565_g01249 [Spizellomyces sp. 'palustris']|nr:hypothetical protein SpCBS45565_g01249 [Spizellomyces sp. 'palustris']